MHKAGRSPQPNPTGIRSFEKGIQLLQLLRHAGKPLRLTDLARGAGMTASAVRGYMVSLIRTGLVTQQPISGRYDLGPEALHLGLAALRRADFLQFAQETLARLGVSSGQTGILAVWGEGGPVVVAKTEDVDASVYEVRIGTRVTLIGTATGQIFTSYLNSTEWGRLVDPALIAELERNGQKVREVGLARSGRARLPGRNALSAPIFDHLGSLRGALTIIARDDVCSPETARETEVHLRQAAGDLSNRLGYGSRGKIETQVRQSSLSRPEESGHL